MNPDSEPRRKLLTYLGSGAVTGAAGLYGLGQFSRPAAAGVSLAFDDASVDLPADDAIEDLRITGDVTGEFETGAGPSESVFIYLDVEFDRFGSFSDDLTRHPDESAGSVSWEPTYSLVDRTEFTGEGDDVQSASYDNNTVSYDVTAGVEIEVYADGSLVAEAQDTSTGTITFRDPRETATDDGTATEGDDSESAGASVDVSFGFEVEE